LLLFDFQLQTKCANKPRGAIFILWSYLLFAFFFLFRLKYKKANKREAHRFPDFLTFRSQPNLFFSSVGENPKGKKEIWESREMS